MKLANVTIEKGISIPKTNFGATKWQYEDIFSSMEVDDSFAIDLSEDKAKQDVASLRSVLARYSKKFSHKYATRLMNSGASIRVWRVK